MKRLIESSCAPMNVTLTDSRGGKLLLTTDRKAFDFDAVTCSPHAGGFTILNAIVRGAVAKDQLEAACRQTTGCNEIRILPVEASSGHRVLLAPTVRSIEPSSRHLVSRLMVDLFRATQRSQIRANSLLITQFEYARKYPEMHLLGVLDALKEIGCETYGELAIIGIPVRCEHISLLQDSVREVIHL